MSKKILILDFKVTQGIPENYSRWRNHLADEGHSVDLASSLGEERYDLVLAHVNGTPTDMTNHLEGRVTAPVLYFGSKEEKPSCLPERSQFRHYVQTSELNQFLSILVNAGWEY